MATRIDSASSSTSMGMSFNPPGCSEGESPAQCARADRITQDSIRTRLLLRAKNEVLARTEQDYPSKVYQLCRIAKTQATADLAAARKTIEIAEGIITPLIKKSVPNLHASQDRIAKAWASMGDIEAAKATALNMSRWSFFSEVGKCETTARESSFLAIINCAPVTSDLPTLNELLKLAAEKLPLRDCVPALFKIAAMKAKVSPAEAEAKLTLALIHAEQNPAYDFDDRIEALIKGAEIYASLGKPQVGKNLLQKVEERLVDQVNNPFGKHFIPIMRARAKIGDPRGFKLDSRFKPTREQLTEVAKLQLAAGKEEDARATLEKVHKVLFNSPELILTDADSLQLPDWSTDRVKALLSLAELERSAGDSHASVKSLIKAALVTIKWVESKKFWEHAVAWSPQERTSLITLLSWFFSQESQIEHSTTEQTLKNMILIAYSLGPDDRPKAYTDIAQAIDPTSSFGGQILDELKKDPSQKGEPFDVQSIINELTWTYSNVSSECKTA